MVEENTSIVDAPAANWGDGISEGNRVGVTDKYESLDGLAGGYRELVSKMGSRVDIPNDETSAENRSAFYQKLGMPGDVSGYTKPTMAEGMALDEDFFGDMAGIAHSEGVSDKQFSAFVNRVIERQAKAEEIQVAEDKRINEEAATKLHEDWGVDYDKNVEVSKRALRELVPDDIKEAFTNILVDNNLDNNPVFIKVMNSIGAKMLDDTLVKGSPPKEEAGFVPKFPQSADMYATMEGEEGVKSRAYFEAQGHVYP